ncbi:MAG TPA: NUDIX hydrolase [Gaiellales bacterium]|nr:NUDIX hydrolase [Gaiellales bacterium]
MDLVRAAGGVVRRGGLLAVVHRPHRADWTLPKGKLEAGESEPDAALREVAEETGWRAELGADLGPVEYVLPDGRSKRVRWYAMAALEEIGAPADDVDEVRWLSPDEARGLLSYDLDRAVLQRALGEFSPGDRK